MKTLLLILVMITETGSLFGQGPSEMPEKWNKDFTISLSRAGSMSGGASTLTFSYDSGVYIQTSLQDDPVKKKFALSESDREAILKKMRELRINKIKAPLGIAVQDDGWSATLCVGGHCIEGGSASSLNENDRDKFSLACHYLEEFAQKSKPGTK